MSEARAAEYRWKALECLEKAARATSPVYKANWLDLADVWQRMAEAQDPQIDPASNVEPVDLESETVARRASAA